MTKSKHTPETKTIIVLGMHRSGTSAMAGVLSSLGVNMGKNLLRASEFNPFGYFEDKDFVRQNDSILEHNKATWLNPPPVGFVSQPLSSSLEKNLSRLMLKRVAVYGAGKIQDPV